MNMANFLCAQAHRRKCGAAQRNSLPMGANQIKGVPCGMEHSVGNNWRDNLNMVHNLGYRDN